MIHQPRLLFVDAYDSFSENIVALLRRLLYARVVTIKIDAKPDPSDPKDFQSFLEEFDAIILGPGPGNPFHVPDTGIFRLVWKYAALAQIPVLGICLGFQSLCTTFGLPVSRLDLPCHGHAKAIRHYNNDIFKDVEEVVATCYNSLGVRITPPNVTPDISRPPSSASRRWSSSSTIDSAYEESVEDGRLHADGGGCQNELLRVLAHDDDNYIMAVRHDSLPFWGLQFHPESCKSNTACGALIQTWWETVRDHNSKRRPVRAQMFSTGHQVSPSLIDSTTIITGSPISNFLLSLTGHLDEAVHFKLLPLACDRQRLADLCQSLSPDGSVAMLESTKRGRFSIFAFPDELTWHLLYQNGTLSVNLKENTVWQEKMALSDAMEWIENLITARFVTDGAPEIPFWGGLAGFFSYEAGLDLLHVSTADHHSSRTVPEISLMWVDRSIVVDRQENTMFIQSMRRNDEWWLHQMTSKTSMLSYKQNPDNLKSQSPAPANPSLPSHDTYISKINHCQSSLHAGNSYELCLTTSANLTSTASPYRLYTSLQQSNPAPYAAYLHLLDTHVVSSSPEQFLSWSRNEPYLDMMPMKGTLPKSPTIKSVQKAREVLLNPKEEAENLMIADLIRHDLHSTLGPGGIVRMEKLFEVVETESLYQLISHIRGHIPMTPSPASSLSPSLAQGEEEDCVDRRRHIMRHGHRALRTALPPGSMTGAPKKRSCEILRSLEQRNRGVYSGVIGFFDVGGGGEWSVGIRCGFSHSSEDEDPEPDGERAGDGDDSGEQKTRKWHIGAGGAITVLSEDEAEWNEMRAKMSAVLKGFGVD